MPDPKDRLSTVSRSTKVWRKYVCVVVALRHPLTDPRLSNVHYVRCAFVNSAAILNESILSEI